MTVAPDDLVADDLPLAEGHRQVLAEVVDIAVSGYWDSISVAVTGSVAEGTPSDEAGDIDIVIDTTRDGTGYAPDFASREKAYGFAADIIASLNGDTVEPEIAELRSYSETRDCRSYAVHPLKMQVGVEAAYDTVDLDLMVRDDPAIDSDATEIYRN